MSFGRMLDSFFNPQRGYQRGRETLEDYAGRSGDVFNPWISQGQDQYGRLSGAEDRLLDPTSLLNEWMSKYETSPYAKRSMETAQGAGLDAASSQGLLGSNAATQNIQQSSSDIMNRDRQQYLDNLMQKYMAGVGIGQNMYGTGAQMAGQYGRGLFDTGRDVAGMRYGEENAPGALLDHLLSMGVNLAGNYMTGGMSGAMQGARGGFGGNQFGTGIAA